MCVLSTVSGQCVHDLLTSVMVTDANVLSFTMRVFLCSTYSGLLKDSDEKKPQSSATEPLRAITPELTAMTKQSTPMLTYYP